MKNGSSPFFLAGTTFAAFLLVLMTFGVRASETNQPVVVELFTSQGCSSCPPADALLSELTEHEDVIALSLPVDYWDNLGWPDTFASPAHTKRQQAYAKQLGNRQVYTPQMVINGRHNLVGSRRNAVLQTIEEEQEKARPFVPISLSSEDKRLRITIEQAPNSLLNTKATAWIIPYHPGHHEVSIERGENRGRTIAYSNVVEGLKKLGSYSGEQVTYEHSIQPLLDKGINGCLILLQSVDTGEIIGAQKIDPSLIN